LCVALFAIGCSTEGNRPSGTRGGGGTTMGTAGAGGSTTTSGTATTGTATTGTGTTGTTTAGTTTTGSGGATSGGTGGATSGGTGGATGGSGGSGTAGSGGAGGTAITDAGNNPDVSTPTDGGSRTDVAPPPGDASSSSGCGAAMWPASGTFNIDVAGTMRSYIVKIPANYDTNKPYKVIFAWHSLGGTADQIAQTFYYGLEPSSGGNAIFVAGQGLDSGLGGAGWSNTNGQDVNFVAAIVASMKKSYCVDSSRIFSVGMSVGAIMTNMLGCGLGSVFRAIAPLASSAPLTFNTMPCKGEHVAAWFAHGTADPFIPFEGGLATADFWRNSNHCAATSQPANPAGCVAYDGCDPGYPVHWCAFDGGHEFPSFATQAIWNFFSQF
jgi:poly(3-hydroxybutyrate) depolymerase